MITGTHSDMSEMFPEMSRTFLTEDKSLAGKIGYTEIWHCPEPQEGVVYRVVRDEWTEEDDKPVRHIYEWQAA